MSPWPGAPKSASSPPLNPPSTRFPFTLNEHSSMGDVADAMRTAFNGLTVHEQAFAQLPDQIKTQAASAATTAVENVSSENVTTTVTAFNNLSGAVLYFPGLGVVNDQLGVTSYTVKQGDAGSKIIVGDSSAVTIHFDSGITAPWFAVIDNDSTSTASLVSATGSVYGAKLIYPGGFGLIYYDGSNWWAGATGPSGGGASSGGPTASRPAIPIIYQYFFDTTLGLPVWWSGANWVNAAGVIS